MRRSTIILIIGVAFCAYGYPDDAQARKPKHREVKVQRSRTAQTVTVTTRPATIQGNPISPDLRPIYDRTSTRFQDAILYKPSDQTGTAEERQFAVLIAQEAPGAREIPASLRIGALQQGENGQWTVDTSRPTVYTAESFVMLGDVYCTQRVHIWAYPSADGKGTIWRGVRTTSGATRYPLVWEFLSAEGRPTVMFVSRTFEKAAEKEYGKPLPGRRASAERSLEQQPNLAVARVLPDGAEPMGPVVYVDAAAHTQTTVLCRCMQAQASNYIESPYYEILPLDILGDVQVGADGPFRLIKSSTPPATSTNRPWIEQALRTPKRF
jgi:hypothetical protein